MVSTKRHRHQYDDVTGDESALEKHRDRLDQTDYTAAEDDVSEDDQSCLLSRKKYADSIDVSEATIDQKPRYLKNNYNPSQASSSKRSNLKSSKKSQGRAMTFHGSNKDQEDSRYPVRDYLG